MQYDYDGLHPTLNNRKYGRDEPPTLRVDRIRNPHIVLYVGNHDDLATPQDAQWLADNVPAVEEMINLDTDHSGINY